MKFIQIFSAISAALMATTAAQSVEIHAQMSDALVDVGDLDTFWSVWNRMYDSSNARGGLSDVTRPAWNHNCQPPSERAQLSTRVQLSGQWGAVPGYNGWQMRDTLIRSMWRVVEVAGQQQSYPVYRQCAGFAWQESVARDPNAACGPRAKTLCPTNGKCLGAGPIECRIFNWGHKIPSKVRINVYNRNGALRADNYQAEFSSSSNRGAGGCGKAGAISGTLAGFIPGVGSYVAAGISLACNLAN